ncbi:MAG TPA: hypothetical protein VD689_00245 [Nitrosopumilaceae archaeon]|nr:hypothetical protein [Nitrosopumilaceae archaeon]
MEPEEGSGKIIRGFKEKTTKYLGKSTELKEKMQTAKESLTDQFSEIKSQSQEYLGTTKEMTSGQLDNIKSEARDMKKIFQSKDMIYMKTDALAIVLRKLGKTDEFLQIVDKLTREGFRMVHKEVIRDIPIAGGFSFPIGTFYYFQNIKYIGRGDD